MVTSRPRAGIALLLAAAFVALLAAAPLLHHEAGPASKVPNHCDLCAAAAVTAVVPFVSVEQPAPPLAGAAPGPVIGAHDAPSQAPLRGRAPPA